MTIGDGGKTAGVANEIMLAGEAHNGALRLGEPRQRRIVDLAAGQRAELRAVQSQRPRLFRNERSGKSRGRCD